jgi:hypothetical protein
MNMSMKNFTRAAAALALTLSAMTAQAGPLYGADNTLYSIDSSTGASVAVASGNSAYRLGLAWNGNTNTMYSIGLFNGILSTVNLANGATTVVGNSAFLLTGLAFDTTYSTLYARK